LGFIGLQREQCGSMHTATHPQFSIQHFATRHSRMPQLLQCVAAICAIYGSAAIATPSASDAAARPSIAYTIKASDKLVNLSQSLLINAASWPELARFNQLKNPNQLSVGQVLSVPLDLLKPIALTGKIISATGMVRVNQTAASAGSAVPEGAQIDTGADSLAVLELADGSRLTVLPTSIAQVIRQRAYSTNQADLQASASSSTTWFSGAVRLIQGSIDTLASKATRRAQPLEVSTPTSVVGVRGTQFRVSFTPDTSPAARTEVLEGLTWASNPRTAAQAAVAGGFGAAILPQDRVINVRPLLPAPALISASPTAAQAAEIKEVIRSEQGIANLDFSPVAGAVRYRLQLSDSPVFASLQSSQITNGNNADIGTTPNGQWNIRIRGIDDSGLEGFDSQYRIVIKDAPKTVPQAAPVAQAKWLRGIAVGASVKAFDTHTDLSINTSPSDFPKLLFVEISQQQVLTPATRVEVVNGIAKLPALAAGQAYILRFGTPQGQSVAYNLDTPSNWRATVLEAMLGMRASTP
jgi:hypothetical protein